jgi:hypothetical protein
MLSIPFRGNGAENLSDPKTIASAFLNFFWMLQQAFCFDDPDGLPPRVFAGHPEPPQITFHSLIHKFWRARYTCLQMLSLFKSKTVPPVEPTFRTRVQQFWSWYTEVAPRFYQTIEAGKCPELAGEVSAKVENILPGFAWVFGPGPNEQGHSFTFSGDGNPHLQLLAIHWLAEAPTLDGWTFYAARQPHSIRGMKIETGGRKFDPLEFWITPFVNRDEEKVDIKVWHPLFEKMPEPERWRVLFLFLDEALGEYGTQQWIGKIKHEQTRLADSIPLEELNEFLNGVEAEYGWKKFPPGESSVLYQLNDQHNRFLRGDILTGVTMQPRLIDEYLQADSNLADPLKGTGADYVFVAFDAAVLPDGNQAGARGEIEDFLDGKLKASASGRLLGGALGRRNAYVDLLLFDGATSIKIVADALREKSLPQGTSINYFAKEKKANRIVI